MTNEPPRPHDIPHQDAGPSGLGTLRDPITIVILVSTALLLIVYYHGHDIVFVPQWAQATRLNWFGLNFLCLFIVPVLLTKYLLRWPLSEVGLQFGDWRLQLRYFLLFGGVTIPVILIASRFGDFQTYYGQYMWMRNEIPLLIVFQLGWAVYFLAWEFFFRGFLLQVLGRRFGPTAIALQTMPFVMMHFGKPELESIASIIAGVALGVWGWHTRSFIGPWLLHWISSAAMILAVMFWASG